MDDYADNDNDDNNPVPNMDDEQNYGTLVEFLTDNPEMKRAAAHSLRQGLCAGGGAVVGGLLLGPLGGLAGGVAGSLVGYYRSPQYEGVVQNLRHLERTRQEILLQQVRAALLAAGATARNLESADQFKTVLVQYAAQPPVRDQIWKACVEALEEQRE